MPGNSDPRCALPSRMRSAMLPERDRTAKTELRMRKVEFSQAAVGTGQRICAWVHAPRQRGVDSFTSSDYK